jgi:hypothetical protein
MDDAGIDELPPTVLVRPPRSARWALPRVAGIVGGGVLLGFVLGLGTAWHGRPAATLAPVVARAVEAVSPPIAAPAVAASSSPAPSVAPVVSPNATDAPVVLPPADALPLPAALAAFQANSGWGLTSAAIISARLTTFASSNVPPSSFAAAPDEWMWVFVVRGSFPSISCGGYSATPPSCPPPATTMRILLDARTGEFVLATSPARP